MEQLKTQVDAEKILALQLPMLTAYLRHLVGSIDDAEDLAQEVCLEAIKNPEILIRGADCGAYLRGIARHLSSKHHKRIQRTLAIEELIDLAWETPAEPVDRQPEQRALKTCMEQLSEKLRGMILWRYNDNLNSTDIAQRLNSTAEAVRMTLARTRQSLSKCIRQRMALAEER
jgi:RNA polymerase sigma-70 factor, ECF subfamily